MAIDVVLCSTMRIVFSSFGSVDNATTEGSDLPIIEDESKSPPEKSLVFYKKNA